MTEAWMKRGAERQEFLEDLKKLCIDKEPDGGSRQGRLLVQLEVCTAFNSYFAIAEGITLPALPSTSWARNFLEQEILPAVDRFARTPEEKASLLADLFVWEVDSIAASLKAPLQSQEIGEPERVFDGHRAMDKVD